MSTWILREAAPGPGLRVAIKDLIDVAGLPTTAGSRAVADQARPAAADAACLAGLRAAIARGEACLAGKVNLHELAYGISGINRAFGTPVNPLDPALVPGGSSSGSAVAVATGEADVAYGSDTGGALRISAAVDAALASTGWRISEVVLRGLDAAMNAAMTVLDAEAWESNAALARFAPERIGNDVLQRLRAAGQTTPAALGRARQQAPHWRAALSKLWDQVDLLALPTLLGFPPALGDARALLRIRGLTSPVNLAGLPALALPVPAGGPLPASVQLIGPPGGEERLLAAGAALEQAVRG